MTDARRRARASGQGVMEFALVLPVFLLMLMALLDLGRVIYAQNAINNDAREGSRLGSVSVAPAPLEGWTARYAAIRTAARAMSPGVEMPDSSIAGKPGACPVPADSLTGTCFYPTGVDPKSDPPGTIYVHITVQVPIITPIVSQIVGGSVTLDATSDTLVRS